MAFGYTEMMLDALESIGFKVKLTNGRISVSRKLDDTLLYNSTAGFIDIRTAVKTGYIEINYLRWEPGRFWFSDSYHHVFDEDFDVPTTFEHVFEDFLTEDEREAAVWHLDVLR